MFVKLCALSNDKTILFNKVVE